MSRPYRYAPPRAGRPLVRRSDLLRRVQGRWNRPVTVLAAGAGFGKSSLLAQALDENALARRGDDCWLGCGPGDDAPGRLADGLATALGADVTRVPAPGEAPPSDVAAALSDEMWQRSPRQVCLVVDDVHEVRAGSGGADLLGALVGALPANGHLVLSGRLDPPVPLARLAAQGRVERLDEGDLAFGDDDLAAFAALREVPVERLSGLGGWPALVELRTVAAGANIDDFLTEEVLPALRPSDRRVVATVAALGGADQRLLDAVLGGPGGVDLAAIMAQLPLVTSNEQGWFALHPVWSERLAGDLDPGDRREVQRRGGVALAGRDLHHAVDLLAAAGADDDLRHVLSHECRVQDLMASWEGLGRVHSVLPPAVRASAEGEMVAGIAVAASDLERATGLLSSAARRLADAGDDAGLLCAVEHLALCAHWRGDVDLLTALWGYGERLATLPEAKGLLAIGEALAADTAGRARDVLTALDRLDPSDLAPYWRAPAAWLRASAQLALGFPDAARRNVEVAVAAAGPALRGSLAMLLVNALTFGGETARAREALGQMLVELDRSGNDHNRALGHTMAATRAAFDGRLDDAEGHLARARQHAGPDPRPRLLASLAAAQASIALGRGDEPTAARLLADLLGGRKVDEGRQRYANLRRLAMLYVLLPDSRAQLAAAELGPCYEPGLVLARALVALRERGEVGPAAGLGPEEWAATPAFLPLVWTVELATAAAAGGQADAHTVVTDAGPAARPGLRRLADDDGTPRAVRTWARTLLDTLPPTPAAPLRLGVLGATTLHRAGRAVDHPHWRRERVRALLLVLMARGGGTREELAGSLWPDLDTSAALRNLRVTLSYLLAVLEPERIEGAPSFFVRADGTTLRLATEGWLDVDAWTFEDLLDRAAVAERHGEPSVALDLLRRALRLYRGPYLADAGYEEWALPHRDRLTARFVAAAVRAGELTLAGGDPDDALRLAARALESEPWSEGAHRLSVAAHLARGDRAAAHRAMETCLAQLDDLGVRPTEDTEIVLRAIA
ncbi:MAG TPA: BTAD domain-containing putative transcriptional regulator [Acidimicrobiales bacterium]|nr:BTAD domain-containing putative transcriptional regulator [Acidimicrobiales bacterium]